MSGIPYTLIRSARKTLSIQITPAAQVILRCPRRMTKKEAEAFLYSKRAWVEAHLSRCTPVEPLNQEETEWLKEAAKEDIPSRVALLAARMGVTFGRITLRGQRSRWGSCSTGGNLNFNYLLMLCPEEVRDYVVVHELCHRIHMDHSPEFWSEVEHWCPDHRKHRQWLKDNGAALIGRLPAAGRQK